MKQLQFVFVSCAAVCLFVLIYCTNSASQVNPTAVDYDALQRKLDSEIIDLAEQDIANTSINNPLPYRRPTERLPELKLPGLGPNPNVGRHY